MTRLSLRAQSYVTEAFWSKFFMHKLLKIFDEAAKTDEQPRK